MARKTRVKISLGDARTEVVKCLKNRGKECLLELLDTITDVVCVMNDPAHPKAWATACHDLVDAYYITNDTLKNVLRGKQGGGRGRLKISRGRR